MEGHVNLLQPFSVLLTVSLPHVRLLFSLENFHLSKKNLLTCFVLVFYRCMGQDQVWVYGYKTVSCIKHHDSALFCEKPWEGRCQGRWFKNKISAVNPVHFQQLSVIWRLETCFFLTVEDEVLMYELSSRTGTKYCSNFSSALVKLALLLSMSLITSQPWAHEGVLAIQLVVFWDCSQWEGSQTEGKACPKLHLPTAKAAAMHQSVPALRSLILLLIKCHH